MDKLKGVHLAVGIIGIILFVLSGQYMHLVYDHLRSLAAGPRLLFRSAHIYLLWSSMLNLLLGCYLMRARRGFIGYTQLLGSLAILIGPPLLSLTFLMESQNENLMRPLGQIAIYAAFTGALLHAFAALLNTRQSSDLAG